MDITDLDLETDIPPEDLYLYLPKSHYVFYIIKLESHIEDGIAILVNIPTTSHSGGVIRIADSFDFKWQGYIKDPERLQTNFVDINNFIKAKGSILVWEGKINGFHEPTSKFESSWIN